MWTFCFLQAKTILLVPDLTGNRIYVKISNTLVSLVWIFKFMFPPNGRFIVAGREVWVVAVGSYKKLCKQI